MVFKNAAASVHFPFHLTQLLEGLCQNLIALVLFDLTKDYVFLSDMNGINT